MFHRGLIPITEGLQTHRLLCYNILVYLCSYCTK